VFYVLTILFYVVFIVVFCFMSLHGALTCPQVAALTAGRRFDFVYVNSHYRTQTEVDGSKTRRGWETGAKYESGARKTKP